MMILMDDNNGYSKKNGGNVEKKIQKRSSLSLSKKLINERYSNSLDYSVTCTFNKHWAESQVNQDLH